MILVMGHIKVATGEGARLKDILAAHMAQVAQEEGCDHYSFAFDAADPDMIRIAERWASPEALAAHGQAEHQKAFGRTLRDFTVEAISVKAWNGEFWRTLIGD
ncbi:MAG TPA: antibiotic biosynthesis monooxygenase family protein [Sphingomonas sp.]|jgi:quinol monooxygenase YgiN|nr:antibiotic biosynthesis monooxygenase family protein [Sphingomonas sp.]